ncbi:MAG: hypothetical protein AAB131_00380, partial [Actinomycetota bacterium]
MQQRHTRSLIAFSVVGALALAACGDDAETPAGTDAPAGTTAPAGTEASAAGSLAGVCPETVVIQTDWNPEAEHGFLYNLIGADYAVDTGKVAVKGSLTAGGVDTGVDLEVRSGGPAIGFTTVTSQMYTDDSIL